LARLKAQLLADGVDLIDLADTNPTRHGLGHPATTDILARAAARSQSYDPEPRGPLSSREALAGRFGGSPEDYWLTGSTSQAYAWLFALLGDPGDAIGRPSPGYPLIEPLARYANLITRPYPLHYLHPYGWFYDHDRLAQTAAQVKALVVVDPGNPTGAYVDPATGRLLAELAARPGLALIVDQVFHPYALGDRCQTMSRRQSHGSGDLRSQGVGAVGRPQSQPLEAESHPARGPAGRTAFDTTLLDAADRSDAWGEDSSSAGPERSNAWGEDSPGLRFSLDGLSKRLCAPGLKLAWIKLSGPPAAVRRVRPALDEIADAFLPVPSATGLALPELLDLAPEVVETTRRRLCHNLRRLRTGLPDTARTRHAAGGWTALVDLPHDSDGDLAAELLARHHLHVHPGWFYDIADHGCVALSLLARPEVFAAGCDRLTV
jgi:aspartate/methionine/tyrosine aminotransferase